MSSTTSPLTLLEFSTGTGVALAFLLAAALTAITAPIAIAIADRTGFLDAPAGYKAHGHPTPYLGGAAVLAAAALPILLFSDDLGRYWPLLLGSAGLAAVGTVDDRVNLSPYLRVGTEILAAWLLWTQGLGWTFLDSSLADFLLTAFWVTGIVNAFNLMDNLDGAASSVAAVSSACLVVLALIGGDTTLALIAVALGGALVGFLRFNLASPARIFLGDGGSMAIGFLLAGGLMAAPMGELSGWPALIAAAVVVGLPAFDTSMVVLAAAAAPLSSPGPGTTPPTGCSPSSRRRGPSPVRWPLCRRCSAGWQSRRPGWAAMPPSPWPASWSC